MELPVHAQLGEHIGRRSLGSGSHLLIDILVLESHSTIIIMGLSQYGKIIVGDFSHRISSLIDAVSDLMGNAPAKVTAAHISALTIRAHGNSSHHACRLRPFDADMVPRRIHEGLGEHPLITDVQMPLRVLIQRLSRVLVETLVLIEQIHHPFHGVHGA